MHYTEHRVVLTIVASMPEVTAEKEAGFVSSCFWYRVCCSVVYCCECRYALFVFDNDNLQDTWDFSALATNLTIKNGVVFFQYNPKLCARKIYELLEVTGLADQVDTIDVSPTTNGDGMACQ